MCQGSIIASHVLICYLNHPGKGFPGGMCNRVNPTCNGRFDVDTTKVCDALLKQIKVGKFFDTKVLNFCPCFFSLMETFALVD